MRKIYLVEDETALSALLQKYLQHEGYDVTVFLTGEAAMEKVHEKPDLWVLDINLPGYNGYQLIEAIKKNVPSMPVIFMSAKNEELDRVIGLELGSDDYLAKPFLPRELVIRVNRLVARIYGTEETLGNQEKKRIIKASTYEILIDERIVRKNGETIQLTTKEFELMMYFVERRNFVSTRGQILQGVWGDDYFGSDRVVDDTVRRLRKKLPDAELETVYGFGYKWVNV